jgi:hypothetical protein
MAGNNVVSTVFEEANFSYDMTQTDPLMFPVGEVAALQKIADQTKRQATHVGKGINGKASLAFGAAIEPLLAAQCKHGIMSGIRESCYTGVDRDGVAIPELMDHVGAWSAPPPHGPGLTGLTYDNMYDHPKFREGFALLEKYDLSFEAWCHHKQIPMVTRLARAFPNIAICLCHEGSPSFMQVYSTCM